MRLLLDNNLSPRLVELLTLEGWDVAHARALGLRAATDRVVLEAARNDHRVLVSADTDFGALLAASHDPGPSIVLVRRVVGRRVEELAGIEEDLRLGSIVVIGDDTLRIRRLPIG